jgi:hypothetical protein
MSSTQSSTQPWTAPPVDRRDPPDAGAERAQLDGFLDHHRQTLLQKCAGLTAEQLRRRAVEPSSLSLLGLVRHLTETERSWFRTRLDGQEVEDLYCTSENIDGDFDDVDTADPEADLAVFVAELEVVRRVVARHDLESTFVHPRTGRQLSVRWLYLHMLEEYARHNGHADLLRERIDGATGQ